MDASMDEYQNFINRLITEDEAILEYVNKGQIAKQIDLLHNQLFKDGKIGQIEELFSLLYKRLLELQEKENKRFHKGLPLHNIGRARLIMKYPGADRFFILAFIEDCISYFERRNSENPFGDPKKHPAYLVLKYILRISDSNLDEIQKKINSVYKYPEEVFNKVSKEIWLINETLFDFNQYYFKELLNRLDAISEEYNKADTNKKRALATKLGRTFENFVEYLFNSVNGFKVVSKNLRMTVNEIDRIVENYSDNPALRKFGQYILIECKNSTWRDKKSKPYIRIGSKVVDHLLMTMRRSNCNMGILISRKDFANTVKKTIYFEYLKSGYMILPIGREDLERIEGGENFVNILLERYNEMKFFKL